MKKTIKIILNVAIFLVIAGFVWYMARMINKDEVTFAETTENTAFESPYEMVSSFTLPQEINRFELYDGKLFIAAGQLVYIYDTKGVQQASFPVKENVRDITVEKDHIYVLYPTFIEVHTTEGRLLHSWEACSELSDYCSFTVAGDFLFVTDANNKNLCKYTREGNFVKFIQSPHGFIIPSYSFDIESYNDTIYCTNSGRHLIETYTLNGDFIAAFGGPGAEPGSFAGCCNPAYITFTSDGELFTSEKGNPRISSFDRKGTFKKLLLNSRLLGGGNKAYKVKVHGDQLFVAGKNKMAHFAQRKLTNDNAQ